MGTSCTLAPQRYTRPVLILLCSFLVVALLVGLVPKAAAAEVGIYSGLEIISGPGEDDANAVELGVRFTVSTSGSVVALRFYKTSKNVGEHTGSLWSSSGRLLARATFTNETASGWQITRLSKPVAIVAGRTYVASYHTDAGHYAQLERAFAGSAMLGNSTMRATAGVYRYGPSGYPRQTWHSSAYFVDPLFVPSNKTSSTPTVSANYTASAGGTANTISPTPTLTPAETVTATPTRTPSGTATAPVFPDASNTGVPAGTVLSAYSGPMTITAAGTVIEGKQINGRLTVNAANVTIRNSRITSNDYYGLLVYAKNLLIEDSIVDGAPETASIASYESGQLVARRINVSGGQDGVRLSSNSVLEASYIHDLSSRADEHNDSVTADGYTGVKIIGNTILNKNGQTAAVWIGDPRYGDSSVELRGNLLGGGGYAIYAGPGSSVVADNKFTTRYFPRSGYYGPVTYWESNSGTWTGNIWADGPNKGRPVAS
jgi:Domain of unknown function (DUF4082)/Right handed beta helix region